MGFSFLSWNIKKFKANTLRTKKVADLIKKYNPDIFGILEFSNKDVARKLAFNNFKDYDFGITESRRDMEIIVGYKRTKFAQAIFTQRREFNANNLDLRPGAILSVRQKASHFLIISCFCIQIVELETQIIRIGRLCSKRYGISMLEYKICLSKTERLV